MQAATPHLKNTIATSVRGRPRTLRHRARRAAAWFVVDVTAFAICAVLAVQAMT